MLVEKNLLRKSPRIMKFLSLIIVAFIFDSC
jgi:hypothetical protein